MSFTRRWRLFRALRMLAYERFQTTNMVLETVVDGDVFWTVSAYLVDAEKWLAKEETI